MQRHLAITPLRYSLYVTHVQGLHAYVACVDPAHLQLGFPPVMPHPPLPTLPTLSSAHPPLPSPCSARQHRVERDAVSSDKRRKMREDLERREKKIVSERSEEEVARARLRVELERLRR